MGTPPGAEEHGNADRKSQLRPFSISVSAALAASAPEGAGRITTVHDSSEPTLQRMTMNAFAQLKATFDVAYAEFQDSPAMRLMRSPEFRPVTTLPLCARSTSIPARIRNYRLR